ncbi:MAG: DUF86 domain-containing protein [Candidatus Magasanikbacteria bacterium]|nr:DUF86 domain-containing protein [Candidatus Magasanikbacteria bacterium]
MSLEDSAYYHHIYDAIEHIHVYTKDMSFLDFARDTKTIDACVHQLQIIGEAANQMSSDGRSTLPAIPWPDVISMRNHIVHEYFGVDIDTVWTTIVEDLPILEKHMLEIIKKL